MKQSSILSIAFAIALLYFVDPLRGGRYDWMGFDNFDTIDQQMVALQKSNCRTNPSARLPYDTLAQLPRFNQLLQVIIFQNRTKLLHVHNLALSRAYFLALIYQKLNRSEEFEDFSMQPGMEYYYYTQAADLIANPYSVNGSALFMDNDCTYANWYKSLEFNHTLPLFGPRAWRLDDYNQPYNFLREPSNHTIFIEDYGTGSNFNYTSPTYGNNPWYTDTAAGINYLPDLTGSQTTVQKYQYYVGIKWAAGPGQFLDNQYDDFGFFGPPLPGQKDTYLPVLFTSPYFDCGRTNHWIISAVAPVVDFMPRYSKFDQVRRPRYTGLVVMDTDFLQIDINQCPTSPGNQPPNYFANTARCKPTTQCMPLMGWGFRRGGYQCMCLPGYRYPYWQNGPFQGIDIEQATQQEYENGFNCIPVGWLEVWPFFTGIADNEDSSVSTRRKRSVMPSIKIAQNESSHIDALINNLMCENCTNSRTNTTVSDNHWISNAYDTAMRYIGGFFGGSRRAAKRETKPRVVEQPIADNVLESYVNDVRESDPQSRLDVQAVKKLVNESMQSLPHSPTYRQRKSPTEPTESKGRRTFVVKNSRKQDKQQEKENKRYKRGLSYNGAITDFDQTAYLRMKELLATMRSVSADNCAQLTPSQLQLPGDVAYGVETMFDNQARTALRLASFISAFLQNEDPAKTFGDFKGDKPLNVYQLFGESIANVMGDLQLMASGIFFDQNAFVHPNGTVAPYFGPWAFRPTASQAAGITGSSVSGDQSQSIVTAINTYLAVDYTGFPNLYVNEPWFSVVKQRWGSNTYGLQKLLLLPYVRNDITGSQLKNFDQFPIYYRSPGIADGFWSAPYYECNLLHSWVVTYSAPFFGWNALKTAIQFKGVVTTTVDLQKLDINQCPSAFFIPNAFANTARCDLTSTYCDPIPGRGFNTGGYKCECRQGFEYPFDDRRTWFFDGMTMETQYDAMVANNPRNFYSILRCREAGASQLTISLFAVLLASALPFALR